MRLLLLAVLGLTFAAGPLLAGPAHANRQTAQAPAAKAVPMMRTAMAKTAAGAARLQPAGFQHVVAQPAGFQHGMAQPAGFQHGMAQPAAPLACTRKARHCRGGGGLVRAHFGWTQGLPAAAGVQANECPDGTLATLARGHEDVVRCMPI